MTAPSAKPTSVKPAAPTPSCVPKSTACSPTTRRTTVLLDKPALSGKWLSAPVPEEHVFDVGETLAGRFEIVRFIGRGGMGEVYEAEDLELHERVALKTLLPEYSADPRHIARFRREVHVARRVKHPNVCKIHDVGRHRVGSSDITFLTMELLAGENLGDFLKREGNLEPTEAVPFFKQLGAGLQALHDQKIVHRDFKPGNIMLVSGRERQDPPRHYRFWFGSAGQREFP